MVSPVSPLPLPSLSMSGGAGPVYPATATHQATHATTASRTDGALPGLPRTSSTESLVRSLKGRPGSFTHKLQKVWGSFKKDPQNKLQKGEPLDPDDPVILDTDDPNAAMTKFQMAMFYAQTGEQMEEQWRQWSNSVGDGAMGMMQINSSP